jgi:hypothetical protein
MLYYNKIDTFMNQQLHIFCLNNDPLNALKTVLLLFGGLHHNA